VFLHRSKTLLVPFRDVEKMGCFLSSLEKTSPFKGRDHLEEPTLVFQIVFSYVWAATKCNLIERYNILEESATPLFYLADGGIRFLCSEFIFSRYLVRI
jgi:hypothetical protein